MAWGVLIPWYYSSFLGISGIVARIGAYSNSIYLFHFFVIFRIAGWVYGYCQFLLVSAVVHSGVCTDVAGGVSELSIY